MKATISDLRSRTRELLDAVDRGQTIEICDRGKLRARLTPVTSKAAIRSVMDHPAFGMWKDHAGTAGVASYVRKLRKSRIDWVK